MQSKWILFLGFMFLVASIFSNLIDGQFVGTFESSHLGNMINGLPFVSVTTSEAGTQIMADAGDINPITNLPDFFNGLWGILSWDYSFFEGTLFGFPLEIFRWAGLIITLGFMVPLAFSLLNIIRTVSPI